ncbi:MAG: TonB-dependent receptor [Alphaproteobacteria bacterium]|nr:TonB-dependent receptor [Alphaproteobacteria bacterium]MBU0863330.1 TonB-dependent receptor [Alphaproteobacteria bacterium]MBU1825031.1 TonB-dependent receptor [Alphaproteobacteria bacterium]
MKKRFYTGTAIALIAATMAQPAFAQAAADGDDALIVVTAQKREQKLVDVPMAISVLGGEELAEKGVSSVQDLSFSVPGLTMREDGPGSYTIFMRGLANQSGSGALVGQYLDEVPLSLGGFTQLSPVALDLARIEVLKGPQGTLYGQGAAAGVIRYITNKPDLDAFTASVTGEVYDVDQGEMGYKASGIVNVPLSAGKAALRVAALYEDGGGWIDQPEAGIKDGNGTELLNVRAQLLVQPTDRFSAKAMVQIHRAETRLGLGYEEPDRAVDVGVDRAKMLIPKKFDYDSYHLELNYDFGFAQLVSATTYTDFDEQYPSTYIPRPGNFSFGFVEGNDDRYGKASQFSQELRLASSSGPLQWTVGGFYALGKDQLLADYEYVFAGAGDLYENGGIVVDDLYYFSKGRTENFSIFADISYDLTDRLTVGGGLRYFRDKQRDLIELVPDTGVTKRASFESTDPRVVVSYRFADNARFYASYAQGFRSGGFNQDPFGSYGPENVETYEFGSKGSFGGGLFQYEVAGFITNYSDMIRRRLTNVNGQFLSESSNIGKVRVKGLEFGVQVRPATGLTFGVNAAYLDSKIVDTDAGDVVNVIGDRTDYTPKLSYSASANYDFAVSDTVDGFARVDFNFRDKVTYTDRSSFMASVLPQASDTVSLLNARFGFDFGRFSAEVYGSNLLNVNRAIDPYQGWANSNRTRPRVIGLKLGADF